MQIAAVGERAPAEINLSGNDRLVGDTSQHEIRHDIWKIMRGRVTVQIASAVTPNSNVCSRSLTMALESKVGGKQRHRGCETNDWHPYRANKNEVRPARFRSLYL